MEKSEEISRIRQQIIEGGLKTGEGGTGGTDMGKHQHPCG